MVAERRGQAPAGRLGGAWLLGHVWLLRGSSSGGGFRHPRSQGSDRNVEGDFVSHGVISRHSPRVVRKATRSIRRLAERTVLRKRDSEYVADEHVDVLINFPDRRINLYQIRQWYGPLEWLSQHYSVAVFCYNPMTAKVIQQETSLRVLLTPTFSDISEVATSIRPDVVLYPNQNYQNYRILGYNDAVHAFICHGESDKIYMASNWLKGFDYFLIAGEASRQRLSHHLLNYDVDNRTLPIGRPQIDIPAEPFIDSDPNRITVLYAPTWEGGRKSMSYGSVLSHGEQIIEALLADERFRIIYRPHPRTGVRSGEERQANKLINERLTAVIESDPGSGHLVDTTPFGWQLEIADVMITDISAVAYDWLTTAKPLIMTRPVEPTVPVADDGLVGALDLLPAEQAGTIVSLIEEQLTDETQQAKRQELADYYYGDRTPGKSLERFLTAITQMVNQSRGWKAGHVPQAEESFAPSATLSSTARSFSTTLARQFGRTPRREAARRSSDVSLYQRQAEVVFSVMGTEDEAGYAFTWLPFLERLNLSRPIAVVCGEFPVYQAMKEATGLRVFYIANTVRAEQVMDSLNPLLTIHATQTRLTLRETTYRSTIHAYLADFGSNSWINYRLGDFDEIIVGSAHQESRIRSELRPLPPQTRLYQLNVGEDTATSHRVVIAELVE